MNYLERQYLRAAYDLAMNDPRRAFYEEAITNHLDLDTSLPDYADRFIGLSGDLMRRGYIQPDSKGGGVGRRTLRLTMAGIDEAERLADPIEQRKELRRAFLRSIHMLAHGSPAAYVYWRDLAPEYGFADMERPPSLLRGVAEQLAGSGFITIEGDSATAFRITPEGVDEVEGKQPRVQPSSVVYNIGVAQGSIIGNQRHADLTTSFDFGSARSEIEQWGGNDAGALQQMLDELEQMLERDDALRKGMLARYSDLMSRNEYVIKYVVNSVMRFATAG